VEDFLASKEFWVLDPPEKLLSQRRIENSLREYQYDIAVEPGIMNGSFRTLRGREWIEGDIIDIFCQIIARMSPEPVLVMLSSFFSFLERDVRGRIIRNRAYGRRFFRDAADCMKLIILPIHIPDHWILGMHSILFVNIINRFLY
jgi:Ulp1 family protease